MYPCIGTINVEMTTRHRFRNS